MIWNNLINTVPNLPLCNNCYQKLTSVNLRYQWFSSCLGHYYIARSDVIYGNGTLVKRWNCQLQYLSLKSELFCVEVVLQIQFWSITIGAEWAWKRIYPSPSIDEPLILLFSTLLNRQHIIFCMCVHLLFNWDCVVLLLLN